MKHGIISTRQNQNDRQLRWAAAGKSHPKETKNSNISGQGYGLLFWDAHGILFIDYFDKKKSIKSEFFIALLDRLSEEMKKKVPNRKREKCSFTNTIHRITS